jgi:hypothetical protein
MAKQAAPTMPDQHAPKQRITLSDSGGYTPPPTSRDRDMSLVHHADSTLYNLGHSKAHLDEAVDHMRALTDRMRKKPRFKPHSRQLRETARPSGR